MRTFAKSRLAIELFDEKVLELLALRMDEVEVIGNHKKLQGLPVKDSLRERMLINSMVEKGEHLGLPKAFVTDLYTIIMEYSCEVQELQIKGVPYVN